MSSTTTCVIICFSGAYQQIKNLILTVIHITNCAALVVQLRNILIL